MILTTFSMAIVSLLQLSPDLDSIRELLNQKASVSSLEQITGKKEVTRNANVLREMRVDFAASKSWVEKTADGKFITKMEEICSGAFLANVYDTRNNAKAEFDFFAEDCKVHLDEKHGHATNEAILSIGISAGENAQLQAKNFTPVAVLNVGGKNLLMTTLFQTGFGDTRDLTFNLPEGEQDFFQDQRITVGMRLRDPAPTR